MKNNHEKPVFNKLQENSDKESDDECHGDEGDDPNAVTNASISVLPTRRTGTPNPDPATTVESRQSGRQTQLAPKSETSEKQLHKEGGNIPANKRKREWGEDEDINLKAVVKTHDGKNWDKIAALVPGRTHDQCRQRWRRHLDPDGTVR